MDIEEYRNEKLKAPVPGMSPERRAALDAKFEAMTLEGRKRVGDYTSNTLMEFVKRLKDGGRLNAQERMEAAKCIELELFATRGFDKPYVVSEYEKLTKTEATRDIVRSL